MNINIYPAWEDILREISKLLNFQYFFEDEFLDSFNNRKYAFSISDVSYIIKADLDKYIANGNNGTKYGRVSVLYSLYACRYLIIGDIKYPSYNDWKQEYGRGMTLDHKLPRKYFPDRTFDCDNWQPLSPQQNRRRGTNFLPEGLDELDRLQQIVNEISLID